VSYPSISTPIAFFGAAPGYAEMLLIFAVFLLVFGPKQLPKMARMIGKVLEELRSVSMDFRTQIMSIEDDVEDDVSQMASDAIDVDEEDGSVYDDVGVEECLEDDPSTESDEDGDDDLAG
jgi:Tat protein translocase TatB subunit